MCRSYVSCYEGNEHPVSSWGLSWSSWFRSRYTMLSLFMLRIFVFGGWLWLCVSLHVLSHSFGSGLLPARLVQHKDLCTLIYFDDGLFFLLCLTSWWCTIGTWYLLSSCATFLEYRLIFFRTSLMSWHYWIICVQHFLTLWKWWRRIGRRLETNYFERNAKVDGIFTFSKGGFC